MTYEIKISDQADKDIRVMYSGRDIDTQIDAFTEYR